ncbi:MAG: rod shape-determining protein MreC [Clostridia bacterium]|nr:rod shape-determining protein MreC [Clostridia bacterium]
MSRFFKSFKFKICVVILAALLLGVFVAGIDPDGAAPLSKGMSIILKPLNMAAEALKESFASMQADFRGAESYQEEISKLQEEKESLKEELVDYERTKHRLSAYEAFLDIKAEHPDYSFVPAGILMRDSTDVFLSFTLNVGSDDGLSLGDPVIYGKNLLGAVRELTPKTAVVYTIFHPDVSVAAYEIRTREDCYTESDAATAAEGNVRISGLARTTPVVSGGIVCSSGIGGVYPRDLYIGKVTRVVNSESDISAYALVTPDVDFSALTDVFVITDFDGKNG